MLLCGDCEMGANLQTPPRRVCIHHEHHVLLQIIVMTYPLRHEDNLIQDVS